MLKLILSLGSLSVPALAQNDFSARSEFDLFMYNLKCREPNRDPNACVSILSRQQCLSWYNKMEFRCRNRQADGMDGECQAKANDMKHNCLALVCEPVGCQAPTVKTEAGCRECPAGTLYINGRCVGCPRGSYDNGDRCVPCMANCADCDNSQVCKVCDATWNLSSGGQCIQCGPSADLTLLVDAVLGARHNIPEDPWVHSLPKDLTPDIEAAFQDVLSSRRTNDLHVNQALDDLGTDLGAGGDLIPQAVDTVSENFLRPPVRSETITFFDKEDKQCKPCAGRDFSGTALTGVQINSKTQQNTDWPFAVSYTAEDAAKDCVIIEVATRVVDGVEETIETDRVIGSTIEDGVRKTTVEHDTVQMVHVDEEIAAVNSPIAEEHVLFKPHSGNPMKVRMRSTVGGKHSPWSSIITLN